MKKIVLLYIGILLFSSCSEDILDKEPIDIVSDAVLWEDPVLVDAYLSQCYAEMTIFDFEFWPLRPDDYKSGFFDVTTVTDEAKDGGWWWGSRAYHKYGELKIDGGLLEYWGYPTIRRLNIFINRVPNSPLSEDIKGKRVAEARFLRAFSYFAMVKRFGGIPLITEPQSINQPIDSLQVPRDKEEEIYDFVLNEVDAIYEDLPDKASEDERGRATKYAALALKSRAALYAGSIAQFGSVQLDGVLGIENSRSDYYYQEAYDAAEKIMDSELFHLYNEIPSDKVANYRAVFTDKWNSEVIFARDHNEIPMADGGGGTGIAYDFMATPRPNGWGAGQILAPYLEMIEEYEYVDGSSGKLDYDEITQGLWTVEELWKNKDPRFFATICTQGTVWRGTERNFYNGIIGVDGEIHQTGSYKGIRTIGQQVQNTTGFSVLKYLDPTADISSFSTSTTSVQVFSYREVLLNFAEAAYNLDKNDEALDAINKIRNRAGIALLSDIDREKIRHERKVELAYEGHRYWDVRRWRTAENKLTGTMTGLRYILDYETRKYKLRIQENIDGRPLRFFEHNYYLPLTVERTASNPNMVENPGY